jgi:ABC-type transporter Mla MlaB component
MSDNITDITLGDSLTIAQVGDLYAQLLASLAEEQAVNIDISNIERVDTAALQLLYGYQRDGHAQGLVIIWSNPSKVFCDAVDILGIRPFYQ